MTIMVCKIFFCFLCFLTALIVKNSQILTGIFFTFLKNAIDQVFKAFHTKFGPQWNNRKSSYQVLALFYQLVALTLLNALELRKLSKKIKFKGAWDEL